MNGCECKMVKPVAGFTSSPPVFTGPLRAGGGGAGHRDSLGDIGSRGWRQICFGSVVVVFLESRAPLHHLNVCWALLSQPASSLHRVLQEWGIMSMVILGSGLSEAEHRSAQNSKGQLVL